MELDNRKSDQGSNAPFSSNLQLYSHCHSSCSWRIRFALCLKGIPYEYKEVDLAKGEQYSPEFERLNPLHYVPVLVDDNVVVSDSYAIFLHLEEKYTQKPLLPVDPQLRALNLQVASIVHSSIQPLHMLTVLKDMEKMFGEESKPWAQFTINKGFSALEKLLKDFAATYATGERIYMADIFLAPQIEQAVQKFGVDMSKFPTLSRLYETYKALPEFQASSPQRQFDAFIHNP
ncbi:glutathione S-transferase zeta class isoform X2 [Vigna radiata var. radiata]|uniref:Glutathione S-transferase zeta class isoform X2 n=1 Tax=Vigna radiata var. radiata TaxID=3916 RepID=A0A1S3VXA5_VIGRR|nr:glutathione S-transferase zeta class isoform X2 [Vigna radiata var. radiata]